MQRPTSLLVFALVTLALGGPGVAAAGPIHGDVEIDPTAYALSGNSIHVGIARDHLRVDLGNFALALPQWVHGDDGFDVSFDGFGAKLQYFPRLDQHGAFFGIDGGLLRVLAERQGTDLAARQTQVGLGVHVGYRIALPEGFYVTPWIGVSYQLGASDVTLADRTYAPSSISVFPAIHVGYQFE